MAERVAGETGAMGGSSKGLRLKKRQCCRAAQFFSALGVVLI